MNNNFWHYWNSKTKNFNNKQKGELLEKIAIYYLINYSSSRSEYQEQGVDSATSNNSKIDSRIHQLWKPQKDYRDRGIDIVGLRKEKSYDLAQCKAWTSKNSINDRDLRSFFDAVLELADKGLEINSLIIFNLSKTGELKNLDTALYQKLEKRGFQINQNITSTQLNEINFDSFEQDQKPSSPPVYELRGYQDKAVTKTIHNLRRDSKTKLIMASGTGKTFTAWSIICRFIEDNDKQKHITIIFFCPNLTLIDQTAKNFLSWSQTYQEFNFNFLGICSWSRLARTEGLFSHYVPTFRSGQVVAEKIKNYQKNHQQRSVNIVFSTYQSIHIVISAQTEFQLQPFDLAICDEAHHTVGVRLKTNSNDLPDPKKGFYFKVHDDGLDSKNHLRAYKRLYMTATPKVFKDVRKHKTSDIEIFHMDDESVYGTDDFFDYSYKKAVNGKYHTESVLSDYEIIIAVVKDNSLEDLKDKEWTLSDNTKMAVIAKQLFKLSKNKEDFKADPQPMRRTLFYCNRVWYSKVIAGCNKDYETSFKKIIQKNPRLIANDQPEDIQKIQAYEIWVKHMDGQTSQHKRAQILSDFEMLNSDQKVVKIISNVDVLGEGVDIPALDAVVFVHPRKDTINIAQIVGRVFRKPKNQQEFPKQKGYIILPVVVNSRQRTMDDEVNQSEYGWIKTLVTKMREIDKSLTAETLWEKIKIRSYKIKPKRNNCPPVLEEKSTIGTELDSLISKIKAAILHRVQELQKIELKENIRNAANQIKKEVNKLNDEFLNHNSNLKKHWNQLKKTLTENLNSAYQDDLEVRGFLIQHLIMSQAIKTTIPDSWHQTKVSEVVNSFITSWSKLNLRLIQNLKIKPMQWGSKTTTAFVKEVYEFIFEKVFPRERKEHGIYYTPVHVVDFMLQSTEQILKHHFNSSFNALGNIVLDPFAGTGSFLNRLCSEDLNLISQNNLEHKIKNELYSIELQPLAYYGCKLNIEQTINARLGRTADNYLSADHCLLGDTFTMYEKQRTFLKKEPNINTTPQLNQMSIDEFNKVPINIVIANPPYRISSNLLEYKNFSEKLKIYFKTNFKTTKTNAINNSYLMAWFFATQWVLKKENKTQPAVVAMITLRSWLENRTLDGVRNYFFENCSAIYVVDFPNSGQIFRQVKAPVAITILVLEPKIKLQKPKFYYLKINRDDENYKKTKLLIEQNYLIFQDYWKIKNSDSTMKKLLINNSRQDWLTPLPSPKKINFYSQFILLKDVLSNWKNTVGTYTNRNKWTFNFSSQIIQQVINKLEKKLVLFKTKLISVLPKKFLIFKKYYEHYECLLPIELWSRDFYKKFRIKENLINFSTALVFPAFGVPFVQKKLYYSDNMVDRPSGAFKSTILTNNDKKLTLIVAVYNKNQIQAFVSERIVLLGFMGSSSTKCYVCSETNNLIKSNCFGFKTNYDLAYYLYAILHDRSYQTEFQDVIAYTSEIRIPHPEQFVKDDVDYLLKAGGKLVKLHLDYEQVNYKKALIDQGILINNQPLHEFLEQIDKQEEKNYHYFQVQRLKFEDNKTTIRFNDKIKISNIPFAVYKWKVRENKSPLEWIVSQYRVRIYFKGTEFEILDDPNQYCREQNNPAYLFELILRLIYVSLETINIKNSYSIQLQPNQKFKVLIKKILE